MENSLLVNTALKSQKITFLRLPHERFVNQVYKLRMKGK